ncbi:MAG TPA: hypothetical protein VNH11_10235 [Pirellulales bacterium]|nr:hypothetical protein [Pirellulales bacterium]
MKRVVLDSSTLAKLSGDDIVELCDASGQVIGRFRPAVYDDPAAQPQISDEEMKRRLSEGGGRSLAEIMADWEKRA